MPNALENTPQSASEANIRSILQWLALVSGAINNNHAKQLHLNLLLLRDTAVPNVQRLKLLDLLYGQAERVVYSEASFLQENSLPISRHHRQRIKITLDVLATLTQDYFNTLAELFDPEAATPSHAPSTSLRRAMQAIAWQLHITHLIASPPPHGLWQQLHAAFRTARRLAIENIPGPQGGLSIRRLYSNTLLAAIAQPTAFSAEELEFITSYIAKCTPEMDFLEQPPLDSHGLFWVDADKDLPSHALIRRIPNQNASVLYFSCDTVAAEALRHRNELLHGMSAESLGLPAFAGSRTGPGILLRLHRLWGHPDKRRFPRRRQSYRAILCIGLDNLWHMLKHPAGVRETSEWMVTNESPDGYSLMHMSGTTYPLRVGDIVALQAKGEHAENPPVWHICVVRWAISENPEHIELGLQILANKALAVELANNDGAGLHKLAALILPAIPPLRPSQALVVPPGQIRENGHRITVLQEEGNLRIRELRPTQLDEQTSSIEIFSLSTEVPR